MDHSTGRAATSPTDLDERKRKREIGDEDEEGARREPPGVTSSMVSSSDALRIAKEAKGTAEKPKTGKIGFSFTTTPTAETSVKRAAVAVATATCAPVAKASVFGSSSSSDEEEEMPAEARLRMRNRGKDTPTSEGPRSYGKGKDGFMKKQLWEERAKVLEEALKDTHKA